MRYLNAAEDLRENPGQWKAYNCEGNCVVLAGPGSGKTKTLTIKVARMLAEEVTVPRGIACLTYNSECVHELKRKLMNLGVQEDNNIFIGTVHSFCLQVILLPYGKLAGVALPYPFNVALPSEQKKNFEHALAETVSPEENPSPWRTKMEYYRRTYLDRDKPEWQTSPQIAKLIGKYEEGLRLSGLIDFEDMVLLGMHLVEKEPWIRKAVRARFPVLVVDEYQDLGIPLDRIVKSLCLNGGMRLFAVGDPDQSIYGFAGAKPELLRDLSNLPGIETIPLRFNYRCGSDIIQASQITLGEDRGYKFVGGYSGSLYFHQCPDGINDQASKICNIIIPKSIKRDGKRNFGDIAVLYMDKNDGDIIAKHASIAGIKFIRIDNGAPYRKTPLIHWLEDCASWCSSGWIKGVPSLDSIIKMWKRFNRSSFNDKEQHILKVNLVHFLFSHRSSSMPLFEWLSEMHSHCLGPTFSKETLMRDESNAFDKLLNASEKGSILEDFTVGSFAGQSGYKDHLNLITLHSAKGLEFEVVIMMGMDQGRIPSWRAKTSEEIKESRRLFYVGMTRAKKEVHFVYSGFTENQYGRRFMRGASDYVKELLELMEGS